jgi:hypothetical protein
MTHSLRFSLSLSLSLWLSLTQRSAFWSALERHLLFRVHHPSETEIRDLHNELLIHKLKRNKRKGERERRAVDTRLDSFRSLCMIFGLKRCSQFIPSAASRAISSRLMSGNCLFCLIMRLSRSEKSSSVTRREEKVRKGRQRVEVRVLEKTKELKSCRDMRSKEGETKPKTHTTINT